MKSRNGCWLFKESSRIKLMMKKREIKELENQANDGIGIKLAN